MGVTFDQESLSRLTLRQLRIKASELGIPLYSRKSKADLVKGVFLYEEKKELEKQLINVKGESSEETTYSNSSETKSKISKAFIVRLPKNESEIEIKEIPLNNKLFNGFVCAKWITTTMERIEY